MRNRLAGQLGRWAMADDATLGKEITALIDRGAAGRAAQPGAPAVRPRARRAGRHQHPHHPCLLPGAAEALSARGRRHAGLRGAGRGRGRDPAARRARTSRSRRWRAPTRRNEVRTALATVARRISIAEYAELMRRLLSERAWLLATRSPTRPASSASRGGCAGGCGATLEPAIDEPSLRAAARAADRGGRQDRWRARRDDGRLARGRQRPRRDAARLSRGVLHRPGPAPQDAGHQARDQAAARHRGHPDRRGRAAGMRARRWRWSSSPWRCCGSASTSPTRYAAAKRRARPARLRRPDRRHAPPAGRAPRAPPGCSTSSTAASTMCWSTRRRTPTPTSGR